MSDWPDMHTYILDAERRPVKVDWMECARWFESFANRKVAQDQTKFFEVSTVFLGLDHNWSGKGPPILFETMVFEREATIKELFGKLMPVQDEVATWRYASWDDAETGHKAVLHRLLRQEADALSLGPRSSGKTSSSPT